MIFIGRVGARLIARGLPSGRRGLRHGGPDETEEKRRCTKHALHVFPFRPFSDCSLPGAAELTPPRSMALPMRLFRGCFVPSGFLKGSGIAPQFKSPMDGFRGRSI